MKNRWSIRSGVSGAALAIAASALLTGCVLGPDFTRPAPPAADAYTPQPLPAKTVDANAPGGAAQAFVRAMDIPGQWWTLFHSDQLNRLIEESLRANPSLQAAQASLRQARESYLAAGGALYPTVSAAGGVTREKLSGAQTGFPSIAPYYTIYDASVSVSYDFDIFGGTERTIESLGAQAEYQQFEVETAYLTLTSNIVTAAVTEAALRAQIAATEDIIGIEEEQLGVLQRQFELGGIARSDVLAQQATVAQTRATLPPLQSQLTQTRNLLAALVGHLPNQDVAGTFELTSMHLPEQLPVTLPSLLVEHRPDIRAAEAQMHAASAQIGVARAAQFPDFTLTGQLGVAALDPTVLFTPADRFGNIGGSIAATLFDGDTLYHKKEAAVAAYDAAAAQYRNTVIQAFETVANALRALEYDAQALRAELAAEQSAADSLSIVREQFQAGAITDLQVLNAEQAYQTARINLVKAQATRYADTAALFQALGGGWWNRTDIAPENAGTAAR